MPVNDPLTGWVDPNPPDTTEPGARRTLIIAAVALTGVVLVALVGVVSAKHAGVFGDSGGDRERPSFILVAANTEGDVPFMPSVLVAPVEIADTVAGDIASFIAQLPPSAARGARLVPGSQPGLYGSVGKTAVCDVPAVANYLDAHPEKSAPWALATGIAPQKIPYYLNTLTPVALIADTWVTFSAFVDGRAVPTQTVLQAGTAVLIDQVGVPRMHCATGDPLAPPANIDLADLDVHGKRWPEFAVQNVVAIAYAANQTDKPVTEFTLRDLSSGETGAHPAGGNISLGADPSGWVPDPVAMNVPPTKGTR